MIVRLVDLISLLDFSLSFVLTAESLSGPLSYLYSKSGTLPRDWVTANIVPVHKKSDRCVTSNYRPISASLLLLKLRNI